MTAADHHADRAAALLKAADAAAVKADLFDLERLQSDEAAAWIERATLLTAQAQAHAALALALVEGDIP